MRPAALATDAATTEVVSSTRGMARARGAFLGRRGRASRSDVAFRATGLIDDVIARLDDPEIDTAFRSFATRILLEPRRRRMVRLIRVRRGRIEHPAGARPAPCTRRAPPSCGAVSASARVWCSSSRRHRRARRRSHRVRLCLPSESRRLEAAVIDGAAPPGARYRRRRNDVHDAPREGDGRVIAAADDAMPLAMPSTAAMKTVASARASWRRVPASSRPISVAPASRCPGPST